MTPEEIEQHVRRWAAAAKGHMARYGVAITSARWYVPRQGQRKMDALFVCLDGGTDNAAFFGREYRNRRRGRLIELAYEMNFSMPGGPIPVDELILDIRVHLGTQAQMGKPVPLAEVKHGVVDVTTDNEVRFVPIQQLRDNGIVQAGSMFDEYCRTYEVPDVLMHGRHYISPDSASVNILEDLMDVGPVTSVLEIGAGVGICGVAAQRRGIEDYTFVDLNPAVCRYVQQLTGYRAYCADAMSFIFNRHWDVVLVGIPYELNPDFLAKRGNRLAENCDVVVFQSGCRGFFDFEHDWLMGRPSIARWPWYRQEQTLGHHFPHVAELSVDWQLAAVGCNNEELYHALLDHQHETYVRWHNERIRI